MREQEGINRCVGSLFLLTEPEWNRGCNMCRKDLCGAALKVFVDKGLKLAGASVSVGCMK